MIESGGVNNSGSLMAQRASEVVDQVRSGEKSLSAAKRENPADVFKMALEMIQAHGWDRKTSQALRRARTDMLVMDEDPAVAAKAIELSQKEDGVGQVSQATQVNVFRDPPPPAAAKFFEGVTDEENS